MAGKRFWQSSRAAWIKLWVRGGWKYAAAHAPQRRNPPYHHPFFAKVKISETKIEH
jgi:hypothetical protein